MKVSAKKMFYQSFGEKHNDSIFKITMFQNKLNETV